MTHQEVSKHHQGDEPTNNRNLFKEESNNVIVEQPHNPRCPVSSFEISVDKIDRNCTAFFQQPKKNVHPKLDTVWYNKKVLGENTLSSMLKTISTKAQSSKIYTNHTLRHTTATAMGKQYNLQQIASVTGHENYQCLETYINEPDEEDHVEFCDTLFDYTGAPSNVKEAKENNPEAKNRQPKPSATVSKPPENELQNEEKTDENLSD